jgi:2-dehydropantoate 2-reductase
MSTILVVGAGGVGTVLAAGLADAGHDVVVGARTARPLVLERDGRARELALPVVVDPEVVGQADWVFLCTKAQDTGSTAPWLLRACGSRTTLAVCQNGIDHANRVGGIAGPATVLPCLVYIAAERIGPGRTRHRHGAHLVVPAGPPAERLAALGPEGIEVRAEADFRTAAWRKLLTNVAANAVTALTCRRMEVLAEPGVRALAARLLAEAVAVGRAAGAAVGSDDVAATLDFYDGFGPDDGTSMLYDRLAGRPTECDLFNGAVVGLGRRHGVPTPANETVLALLRATEHPAPTTARTAS